MKRRVAVFAAMPNTATERRRVVALVGAAAIGLGAVALAAGPEIAAGAAVATAGGAARAARFAKIAAMAIAAGAVVAAAVKEGTEQLRERTEKRVVS